MTTPKGASSTFEEDIAYVAERLRETYNQEGVDVVLAHVRKVQRESADLRGRVDRTVEYTEALLRATEPSSLVAAVAEAVQRSLTTPVAKADKESSS